MGNLLGGKNFPFPTKDIDKYYEKVYRRPGAFWGIYRKRTYFKTEEVEIYTYKAELYLEIANMMKDSLNTYMDSYIDAFTDE